MKWWLWRACLFFSNGHESKYISSEVLFIGVVPKTPGHRNYHKDTRKSTRKRMISKLSITNKNNPVVIQAWHPWHSPSHRSWGICVLICEQLTSLSKHSDPLDWWTPCTNNRSVQDTPDTEALRDLWDECGLRSRDTESLCMTGSSASLTPSTAWAQQIGWQSELISTTGLGGQGLTPQSQSSRTVSSKILSFAHYILLDPYRSGK